MTLTVNGSTKTYDQDAMPLSSLLADLGFAERPVLVEHNGTALLPRTFPDISLRDGDQLEIIQVVAGG